MSMNILYLLYLVVILLYSCTRYMVSYCREYMYTGMRTAINCTGVLVVQYEQAGPTS